MSPLWPRHGAAPKRFWWNATGILGASLINGAMILHGFFNMNKTVPGAEKVQVVRGIPQESSTGW